MVEERQEKRKIDEITKCPECGSTQLVRDYERGELVCNNCGIVIDDSYIDQGPEWRAFDSEQNDSRARAGSPMTFTIHDKGLSTDISWKNKDSYGKSIPTRNRAQLYRLRKWQKRIKVSNAAERNLSQALQELERMASNLSIPNDVRETAAVIYRKAVKQNMIRGRSIEGVVAGSIYAACRITNVPRTLEEIASVTRVKKKEIGRTYRIMSRYLKLNIMPSKPDDYINRFCSRLKLSMDARKKATEILKLARDNDLTSGKGPTGVAAAAIYIASLMTGERRTQRAVAEVAGVTEVTIRNRYKELTEKLSITVEQ
ncbi:MAG: transcription initiation factor IIB [Thermoplasmatales archaeon B_DKE]|nr:MAG: transcription initiation factor IIB [Thermoplasmatales archaeon B_DKE]QRF76367.1 Transcription initiation factor IIB [Thermoplasmatales archaeon]